MVKGKNIDLLRSIFILQSIHLAGVSAFDIQGNTLVDTVYERNESGKKVRYIRRFDLSKLTSYTFDKNSNGLCYLKLFCAGCAYEWSISGVSYNDFQQVTIAIDDTMKERMTKALEHLMTLNKSLKEKILVVIFYQGIRPSSAIEQ